MATVDKKPTAPAPIPPGPVAARVIEVVSGYFFRWRDERDLQESLVKVFTEAGITFERERSFLAKETGRRELKRADGTTTTLTRLDTQVLPTRLVPRPETRIYEVFAADVDPSASPKLQKKDKGGTPVTSDRPDFFMPPGVVVEVKVDGGPSEVMRQLFRYGKLPEVEELVLVTGCSIHLAMPPRLANKPVHVAYVGGTFGGFR